jgi:hypothetical protein
MSSFSILSNAHVLRFFTLLLLPLPQLQLPRVAGCWDVFSRV